MKFKTTYLLAGIAILFGVYLYFFEIRNVELESKLKEQSEKILIFEPEKVKKLTLYNSFGTFVLEKDSKNEWQMISPIKDAGDSATIQSILTTLSNEKYEQIVSEAPAPEDLKSYGLEKPKLKADITFNSGETKTILVGSDAAIAGKLYLQKEGDKKILFAGQSLKYQIEKNPRELRDKKIIKKPREQLSSVVIKTPRSIVEILQKDKKWYIEKPFKGLADPEVILSFFNSLESLRATDFTSEKSFSGTPVVQIEFYDKPGHLYESLSLSPQKENSSYVKLKSSKNIFQVFTNSTQALVKNADDFRDRKSAFEFSRPAVEKISVKTELAKYEFTRRENGWDLTPEDPKKQANQSQVVTLLNKLMEMKTSEFVTNKSIGKSKGQIIFKTAKDEVLLDLQWGDPSPSGKSILVKTQKTEKPVGVDSALISALPSQTLVEDKK